MLVLFGAKFEILGEIFGTNSKVWVWYQLDCGGNDFSIMIHVLENF